MSDSLARRLSIGEGSDHIDVEEAWLPYTLLRILGRGGCSVVEEVEDQTTGSVYARKVFFTTRRNKNHLKQIFENEVNVIRSLGQGHHHMVRVFATYTTRNSLALILSPVANGGDLERYLDALPTNGSDEQLRSEMTAILSQAFGCLAAGLDFLKQNNIRHKDIKTSNILIHNSQVYYTDFGLSFKSGTLENSTTYGLPDGMTPRFAAPEVLQGNPRNSSSDVYSLGCVYVDIFTALSESHLPHGVVYDMDLRFSATMEVIHQQLRLSQSFVSEIVPKLIIKKGLM
ncbi:kinase-like domain-containing protein [Phaeosphaeriaceae sp. PMI808]|nr:kinase-like domain-containing protein [Phaeosphaeriaceae sp. PMI808]